MFVANAVGKLKVRSRQATHARQLVATTGTTTVAAFMPQSKPTLRKKQVPLPLAEPGDALCDDTRVP